MTGSPSGAAPRAQRFGRHWPRADDRSARVESDPLGGTDSAGAVEGGVALQLNAELTNGPGEGGDQVDQADRQPTVDRLFVVCGRTTRKPTRRAGRALGPGVDVIVPYLVCRGRHLTGAIRGTECRDSPLFVPDPPSQPPPPFRTVSVDCFQRSSTTWES